MDMSTVVSKYIGLSEYVNGENKCIQGDRFENAQI